MPWSIAPRGHRGCGDRTCGIVWACLEGERHWNREFDEYPTGSSQWGILLSGLVREPCQPLRQVGFVRVNPGDPWVHLEKVSFRPTENLEFGFERTAIWGGQGHGPITIHTFLESFFSFASPGGNGKYGRDDPGARFGAFDFSYRLPFVRNWLALY